jgi:hypothetical protein
VSVTLVAGRRLPRSTRIGFLGSTSDGCTTSPLAVNMAASVKPCSTSCKFMSRLSMPGKAGPENSILSFSTGSRDKWFSGAAIKSIGSFRRCWL